LFLAVVNQAISDTLEDKKEAKAAEQWLLSEAFGQLCRTAQPGCGRISSTTGRRVNSGVDWLARLGQNSRAQANGNHHRIRRHFYAGFADANLRRCA